MSNINGPKAAKNQIAAKKIEYQLPGIVFAKLKGYPDWPARITSIKNNRYGVCFFGDNTKSVFL